MITFRVIPPRTSPLNGPANTVYLRRDNWNDYSFVTMFSAIVFDESCARHDFGDLKIGFVGQTEEVATWSTLPEAFTTLGESYFSVGLDVAYYQKLLANLSEGFRAEMLNAMRDVALLPSSLAIAKSENVFKTSFLRTLSISTIEDQFRRVLFGGALLTDYDFRVVLEKQEKRAGFTLGFKVNAHSIPATNIHAIIGRNGVGKTSLLNSMIKAIVGLGDQSARFEKKTVFSFHPIESNFFSSLISISFSAFDPFNPPAEQPDPLKGTCYFYVGLKDYADDDGAILKSLDMLYEEFVESLGVCCSQAEKRRRWLSAITTLETDDNFAGMRLSELSNTPIERLKERSIATLKKMSSGHAIVLLTVTKLVARLEEKTLVLFDEPESHLHPPLLAALIRSLSQLLYDRNAVAIIATHSPVVLQEIPRSCVWKISRLRMQSASARPDIETFGENVGVLTREVFGLEVAKSGFNALLAAEAKNASTYEEALSNLNQQLGFEGRAILRSLMHHRVNN